LGNIVGRAKALRSALRDLIMLLAELRRLDGRLSHLEGAMREAIDRQPLALMQLYCQLADRRSLPPSIGAVFSEDRLGPAAIGTGAGWHGVAIISAPKSASTFLFRLIEDVTGSFQWRRILQTIAGRALTPEADLFHAAAIRAQETPTVVREHLLANPNTLLFLEQSRLWPVILWRAIDDSIVSQAEEWERQWSRSREDIIRDGYHSQFLGAVPQVFIDNFMRADWTRRYDMTIDLALPWYCQFIAGWEAVRARNPRFGTFLSYDEIANDCVAAVTAILRAIDLEPRVDVAETALELKTNRIHANFNIGRSGRGRELLTAGQRARIDRSRAAFFPVLSAVA
jgi:hypothetical protein